MVAPDPGGRVTSAREEILARIRGAIRGAAPVAVPRSYQVTGAHPPGSPPLLALFRERLEDYKATVHDSTMDALPSLVPSLVAGRLLVPPGLAFALSDAVVDDGLSTVELDGFDTVLTTCAAACAETGTIVLDAGPGQGRRAISLVPDRHICIVHADQVVHTVPELLTRLDPSRPLTLISGPSATSDIELQRVEGVHGPRTLIVVLLP